MSIYKIYIHANLQCVNTVSHM